METKGEKMKMAEKKKAVMGFLINIRLNGDEYVSPTTIGDAVIPHSDGTSGSSVASPVCKALVEDGLLERDRVGCYRVKRHNASGLNGGEPIDVTNLLAEIDDRISGMEGNPMYDLAVAALRSLRCWVCSEYSGDEEW